MCSLRVLQAARARAAGGSGGGEGGNNNNNAPARRPTTAVFYQSKQRTVAELDELIQQKGMGDDWEHELAEDQDDCHAAALSSVEEEERLDAEEVAAGG